MHHNRCNREIIAKVKEEEEQIRNCYEKDFEKDDPLPIVNIESLDKIEKMITSAIASPPKKEKVAHQLLKNNVKFLAAHRTVAKVSAGTGRHV